MWRLGLMGCLAALCLPSCGRNALCNDQDGDGYLCDDCNDGDPSVHPTAPELCDYIDNDCDGEVDEGVRGTVYPDDDHDGFGNSAGPVLLCYITAGFSKEGGDCNDQDATVHPGRPEVCDYKDNDCNGSIDEMVQTAYYRDADGDGYGDSNNAVSTCQQPGGFVAVSGDCDDSRAEVHPKALETCNARDDDCDGKTDGEMRPCDNACGKGVETCEMGLFAGCTAPQVTTVGMPTVLNAGSKTEFVCLEVRSRLSLGDDAQVHAARWVHVESGGVIEAGPRARVAAGDEIAFDGVGRLEAVDVTLEAGGAVTIDADAKWLVQSVNGVVYSGGGAPTCSDGTLGGAGGAGGGARGGDGGAGGTCGLQKTGATRGAGGPDAKSGAAGCACVCSSTAAGGAPSGGEGGAPMGGGAGGGGGGAGGAGSDGSVSQQARAGGRGGAAEGMPGVEPIHGGGGGGAGGMVMMSNPPCVGAGGAGGGIARVHAATFVNRGLVIANGIPGADAPLPQFNAMGGGGGGAGGALLFRVGAFDNMNGLIAAQGGKGGAGAIGTGVGLIQCAQAAGGGGGGGGGGRIYVGGPLGGGNAMIVARGSLLVGSGDGGAATCNLPGGKPGGAGWVFP